MPLSNRRRTQALWLAGALLLAPQPADAQRTLGIQPAANAQSFAEEPGRRLTFVCPATDGASGYVYGTDVYAEISAVCAAAIHAGVLRPKVAGAVSIVMGPPMEAFKASSRTASRAFRTERRARRSRSSETRRNRAVRSRSTPCPTWCPQTSSNRSPSRRALECIERKRRRHTAVLLVYAQRL